MTERILLDHGSGGMASQRLIRDLFLRFLDNPALRSLDDGACIDMGGRVCMSTDTFTVDPLFFPGGDIGSLAVHGTVNDVAMLGARPQYLSCACLLEEGLEIEVLERIVSSMAAASEWAGVAIVTGDTKVVPRGAADRIYINTTGVGTLLLPEPLSGAGAREGDAVLVNGPLGEHGLTIMAAREGLSFETPVQSDSAPLNHLVERLLRSVPSVRVLRDPTRGGLATALNEIACHSGTEIRIEEGSLPVDRAVQEACSFLGLDPLYLANEGKLIAVVPERDADRALEAMRAAEAGRGACRIGSVVPGRAGRVTLRTAIGGERLLRMLEGEPLPRIC
jgi:hydrogenase expression/formation protein HypE